MNMDSKEFNMKQTEQKPRELSITEKLSKRREEDAKKLSKFPKYKGVEGDEWFKGARLEAIELFPKMDKKERNALGGTIDKIERQVRDRLKNLREHFVKELSYGKQIQYQLETIKQEEPHAPTNEAGVDAFWKQYIIQDRRRFEGNPLWTTRFEAIRHFIKMTDVDRNQVGRGTIDEIEEKVRGSLKAHPKEQLEKILRDHFVKQIDSFYEKRRYALEELQQQFVQEYGTREEVQQITLTDMSQFTHKRMFTKENEEKIESLKSLLSSRTSRSILGGNIINSDKFVDKWQEIAIDAENGKNEQLTKVMHGIISNARNVKSSSIPAFSVMS